MVPWVKLGRAFAAYFFANWVKTLLGAAMVGLGMSMLHDPKQDEGDHEDDPKSLSSRFSRMDHTERYVSGSVLIGFGLFMSLPSLLSQVVWETAIPGVSAASVLGNEVTGDLFTLGVTDYFKSLKSTVRDWKPIGGGGAASRGGDQNLGIASKFVAPPANNISIQGND